MDLGCFGFTHIRLSFSAAEEVNTNDEEEEEGGGSTTCDSLLYVCVLAFCLRTHIEM